MSKIISIGTSVPQYRHDQTDIMNFMQQVYAVNEAEKRKIRYLYNQSGIRQRYSVIPDYSAPIQEWKFYSPSENFEPFPSLETRMNIYNKQAPLLSVDAIRKCLDHVHDPKKITHLITVSCTGMTAPGLDLMITELMDFDKSIFRTSINFMGCYAAIHALKIADTICKTEQNAQVLIVCTELCTLHFQKEKTIDNITSSLLFGDGCAAALVTSSEYNFPGIQLKKFYSEIVPKGKRDMAWELSSTGFLMTLSGYIPDLIEEDLETITDKSLQKARLSKSDISHWCIHPGGKRVLEAVQKSLNVDESDLHSSYHILSEFGNLSSATILFILKEMMQNKKAIRNIFGAAFGPGLTVETFIASN